jgi:hypothetical protein
MFWVPHFWPKLPEVGILLRSKVLAKKTKPARTKVRTGLGDAASDLSYSLPIYLPLTLMLSTTAIPLPTGWSITSAIVFTAIPGVTAGDSCAEFAGSKLTRCHPGTVNDCTVPLPQLAL